MSPKEKSQIIQMLERSREEFNAAASGVEESRGADKPAPDRWSVVECVEHVAFVEGRFLDRLENSPREEAPAADEQKEVHLAASIPDRSNRVVAPEAVRPTGRWASLAEALDQFNAARTRTIQFAEAEGAEVYARSVDHPRFGKLNGMELLVVIAGHSRRHADQIREIRASLKDRN
jgi:DinB superfamily